jgi:predicted RNase H-like HicB family nuclease
VQLTAAYIKVPEGYIAFVEELPGTNTQGATLEEARENLADAVQCVLQANRELTHRQLADADVMREPFGPRELPIPPIALAYPSIEMIRVWLANQRQHIALNIGFWEVRGIDEPLAWGILIADMVHHIAAAHEAEYARDRQETITRILNALQAEMDQPTSERLGEFVNQSSRA